MNRRVWIAAIVVIALLGAATVGAWLWLGREPGPMVEVLVPEAPVKVGQELIATATKGERFRLLATQTGWYQVRVRTDEGRRLGWISAAHVRRVEPGEDEPRRPVVAEILGVYFPDLILLETPPWGQRWVLVEAQAHVLEGEGGGAYPVDTDRFVLVLGRLRFFHPRHWATIPMGDQAVERLEKGDVVEMPAGSSRRFRLAFAAPSELVARSGWRLRYVPREADKP